MLNNNDALKMYKGKHEKQQYDPDMPCNKKNCDVQTRASCCGCYEQFEYERKKKLDSDSK